MRILLLALAGCSGVAAEPPSEVVFLSGEPYSLCAIRLDGSDPRTLVSAEHEVLHFDVGPRGVAYVCDPSGIENFELLVMDPATGEESSVLSGIRFAPAWSPDGSRFAFMQHAGRWKIRVTEPGTLERAIELAPPEHTRFADGFSVNDGAPDWSPDGRSVVFQSNRSEESLELFEVDLETDAVRKLTRGGRASYPACSPDGAWVAFRSGGELHVVDRAGGEPRRLTEEGVRITSHAWFADSGRLLVTVEREGVRAVCELRLADGALRELETGAGDSHSPALSPDEARLLFVSGRDGDDEVFVMEVDGRNLRQLTENEVRDSAPDWLVRD